MRGEWPRATDEEINERIRQAMAAAGLSQRDLTEVIGKDSTVVSKALNGTRRFTSLELALIAEATGSTVGHLLCGEWVRPAYLYPAITKPTSADVTTCDLCGGAVLDSEQARDIHDEWHRKLIQARLGKDQ